MKTTYLLCAIKMITMDKNTTSILTRGVKRSDKKKLGKIADKNNCSLNFIMLHAIDYYLGNDLMIESELKSGYAKKRIKR